MNVLFDTEMYFYSEFSVNPSNNWHRPNSIPYHDTFIKEILLNLIKGPDGYETYIMYH